MGVAREAQGGEKDLAEQKVKFVRKICWASDWSGWSSSFSLCIEDDD